MNGVSFLIDSTLNRNTKSPEKNYPNSLSKRIDKLGKEQLEESQIDFSDNLNKKTVKRKNINENNSLVDQTEFFFKQEPDIWYSFEVSASGDVRVTLPDEFRTQQKLIYIIHNQNKNWFYIGKTESSLASRISKHISESKKPCHESKQLSSSKAMLYADMYIKPEFFRLGVLYRVNEQEDINEFERLFIYYKQVNEICLYNERGGGGGGISHASEESTSFAFPNLSEITPEKYYPYKRQEGNHISPQFSPGFDKIKEGIEDKKNEQQPFLYCVKDLNTGERYVGCSSDPKRRARQHGSAADHCDQNDGTTMGGSLHPALAKHPENFAFGIYPIKSSENISPNKLGNYTHVPGTANAESYMINYKHAHVSQNGHNCNWGGGGPLANSTKKQAARKINFDDAPKT